MSITVYDINRIRPPKVPAGFKDDGQDPHFAGKRGHRARLKSQVRRPEVKKVKGFRPGGLATGGNAVVVREVLG